MADKNRKVDSLAGKKSFADQLKERRKRLESGDLTPNKPSGEREEDPVSAAEDRALDRIERMREKAKKKPF